MSVQIIYNERSGLVAANPTSYEELMTLVAKQQAFLKLPAQYVLKYLDPDGDYITVSSDEDFKIMKETVTDNMLTLQITCGGDVNKSNISSSLSDLSEEKSAEINVLDLVSPLAQESIASPTRLRDASVFQDCNGRLNETMELTKAMKLPTEEEVPESHHVCVSTQKGSETIDMVTQTAAQANATVAVLAAIEQKNQETDTSALLEMKPSGVTTNSMEDISPAKEFSETLVHQIQMKKRLSKSRKLTQAEDSSEVSDENNEHVQVPVTTEEKMASALDGELKKLIPGLVERLTKHVRAEVQQQVDAAQEAKEKAHAYAKKALEHVYPGVKCDTCGGDMIGIWYRCSICTDVNFCAKCEHSIFHAHAFLKIDHPSKAPTFMTLGQQDRISEQNRTFWKRASSLFNFVPPHEMISMQQNLQMMANVVKVYPRHIDTTVEKIYVSLQFSNIGLVQWPEEVILSRAGSFLPADTLRLPALKPGDTTRVTVVIDNVGYVRKLESFWRILFRDLNNCFMFMGNDIPVTIDVKEPFLRTPTEIEVDEADPFHCAVQRLQDLFPEKRTVDLVQLLIENPKKPLIEIINDLLA